MKIQRVEIFANTEPSKDNAANYAMIHIYEGGKNQAFLFSNESVVSAVNYLAEYVVANKTEILKCRLAASKLSNHKLILQNKEGIVRFAYADFENPADRRNAVACVNNFIAGTRE